MTKRLFALRSSWSRLCLATVAGSLLAACDSDGAHLNAAPTATFTVEEQAVYAAILAQHFGSRSYVLKDLSMNLAMSADDRAQESGWIAQDLEQLKTETLENLWSANPAREALPANLQLGAPYALIDQSSLSALVESDPRNWKGFHDRYPDTPGVLAIAHVGFDASGTQALAFLYWGNGGLAAWWRYFLLERKGDTWTIVDDVITIIS